MQLIDLTFRV
ncbi:hypothetical protein DSL72_000055 [Monilinia vaccinii-corymbosi]|uniref:Uncharacterized protein n=1 Tax=Monilinia vaccinii-corymbosi TaxID=61207 RepID=A0A8A3P5R2_9HELO|nr:hypothetical protein DSL72_000055 [Monilinia vaccinii-corymbosi]